MSDDIVKCRTCGATESGAVMPCGWKIFRLMHHCRACIDSGRFAFCQRCGSKHKSDSIPSLITGLAICRACASLERSPLVQFYADREAVIVHLRAGGSTYKEIGGRFGISSQRTEQIVVRAIKKKQARS